MRINKYAQIYLVDKRYGDYTIFNCNIADMELIDSIKALSEKVSRMKELITTEEATKTAFVLPFIHALGYDVFNPLEVVPEYVADLGIKKGEKVDYCIFKDGKPVLIVECKTWAEKLNPHNSQLFRYFHVTATRFAILTNGIIYRFYTDMDEPNKMDERAFMEINLLDVRESLIIELKKFHKSYYDLDSILLTASDLKYSREIKNILTKQLTDPDEAIVKLITTSLYNGKFTPKIAEQFNNLVKQGFNQFISDAVSDRLKTALGVESYDGSAPILAAVTPAEKKTEEANKIITTTEELESFYIVKSIIRTVVSPDRIGYKDTQQYFSIQLDNNVRRQVCRLVLLSGKKSIIFFEGDDKKEVRFYIDSVDDIYSYAERLKADAARIPSK